MVKLDVRSFLDGGAALRGERKATFLDSSAVTQVGRLLCFFFEGWSWSVWLDLKGIFQTSVVDNSKKMFPGLEKKQFYSFLTE